MAAGLTDHVWTLREVLLFRVPPWLQPAQGVRKESTGEGVTGCRELTRGQCVRTASFGGRHPGMKGPLGGQERPLV